MPATRVLLLLALSGVLLVITLILLPNYLFRIKYPVHSNGAILISGTSTGIGRATCGWLATRHPGVTFYCGVRKEKDAVGFPFDQKNVQSVILDVTHQTHIDAVLEQITQINQQPLIGVVNNAGVSDTTLLEFLPEEKLRQVMEVNFFGGFRLTQAALPSLRQTQGRILFVTSLGGAMPGMPFMGAYQSSKHATEAMANSLRHELREKRVSVSIMEPGFLESAMVEAEAARVQGVLDSTEVTAEQALYPELFGAYMAKSYDISNARGRMQETCEAMEDALFSPYPKTRYLTSRMGPLPAWLAAFTFQMLPDRMADWTIAHLEVVTFLQSVRSLFEGALGYTASEEL